MGFDCDWKLWFEGTRQELRARRASGVSATRLKRFFNRELYAASDRVGRTFPWRTNRTPYRVLVSELMLQQTQADRVAPLFQRFTRRFPSFKALARAPQADVVRHWQGLGYNRRALFLHSLAQTVREESRGRLPNTQSELIALPGVGEYTSRSVLVFAFNQPHTFIETNVRAMFIHFFAEDRLHVDDSELVVLISDFMDSTDPRKWYEALMDVGSVLKRTIPEVNQRSSGYQRQSKFKGSFREKRGAVLRRLSDVSEISLEVLQKDLHYRQNEFEAVLFSLQTDGFIVRDGDRVRLSP